MALAVIPFSGCILPSQTTDLDPGVGYQQVEVRLDSMGRAPENLTGVTFSFQKVAFYEEGSRQWVQIGFSKDVRLDFHADSAVHVATITLPMGSYSKMWGSLGSVEVWEGETAHPAVPLAGRCHVPISMVVEAGSTKPVLSLYVFPEDALMQADGTWYARPAFSGSLFQQPDAGSEEAEGNPRFTRPQCETG